MQTPKQVYTTFIRTTPKRLWAAITKPEFTRQYWAGVENVSDWKKGSKWEHIGGGGKRGGWVTRKGVGWKPPQQLLLCWGDPNHLPGKKRGTFENEGDVEQRRPAVNHRNF